MFHGTYKENDVIFLLKKIDIKEIDIENKEKLIQSGEKHYSQMLSFEKEPSKEYLSVFYESLELNKEEFAKDILYISSIIKSKNKPVLVSLARAGTPIGVLIKRTIKDIFNKDINHYSISIIRDKGLDLNALNYIVKNNTNSEIVFLDGWTGKGVISRELKKSVQIFNKNFNTNISNDLYVLSDISGNADYSATNKDYLIPSAILNSTISGLISRTMTDIDGLEPTDFHACKFFNHLIDHDLSLWFIDYMMKIIRKIDLKYLKKDLLNNNETLKQESNKFIIKMMKKYSIKDINHIKPGIGETTRVLLRRVPERLLIKDIDSNQVKHLIVLAKEKGCIIEEIKDMPYNAVGLIAKVKG
ncbi:MAG: cysteine protease StiP family protein [Candidatus Sericytochromatia bacterium]